MKIKTSLFYSLAAASLLGGTANAQDSSVTDPVGFHTLTVYGNGGSGGRFSLVAPGLVNPIEYASATTAITATTVSVEGTPFAGISYGPVADGGVTAYYVEVTDGAEAGAWASITANDDSSVTVNRDLSAAGNGAKIAIRKHVTIADLFGPANEAGLQGAESFGDADEITLFSTGPNGIQLLYYFDDGAGTTAWATDAGELATNTPIEPQQAVYVKRKSPGDLVFTRAGHVKVGPTKLNVYPGYNTVANPRAVGRDDAGDPVFTLGNSNLHSTDPANSVIGAESNTEADEVTTFEDDGSFGLFYYFDDGAGTEAWATVGGEIANDYVLENGKGFIVNRKAPAGPFIWTVPAEPIAN